MYLVKKNIHTTTMKTNIRFTSLIVKLMPFVLLSQLSSLASSESNIASFLSSSLHPLQFSSSVSWQQCCSIDCIEYMQFGFKFKILLFLTSVHFSTKTLAYLAYKAYKAFIAFKACKTFMAFKCSQLSTLKKYHSITSFSVDWPQTIQLVYVSVSILSICSIKLLVIVTQSRGTSTAKTTTPEQIQNS